MSEEWSLEILGGSSGQGKWQLICKHKGRISSSSISELGFERGSGFTGERLTVTRAWERHWEVEDWLDSPGHLPICRGKFWERKARKD
jgi:hypothetical protein